MEKENPIILHADRPLTREQAEAIQQAVAKIGPIHLAGMGLRNVHEKTTKLIEIGIEKLEQAGKEFENAIAPENEVGAARIRKLEKELAELNQLNEYHRNEVEKGNQFREKLKETIVQLHERLRDKNDEINTKERLNQLLEDELERANRVIDALTRKKDVK